VNDVTTATRPWAFFPAAGGVFEGFTGACIADTEKRYEHSTGTILKVNTRSRADRMQRLIELIDNPDPRIELMAAE
jgi:hypothetical protein